MKLTSLLKGFHPTGLRQQQKGSPAEAVTVDSSAEISQVSPPLSPRNRAQSLLELAIILPVLLITIIGMTEIAFFVSKYQDAIDLTREAARFASQRDPFDPGSNGDHDCTTRDSFNYYYDTACIFAPPLGSCPDPTFCNGLNPFISLDLSAGKDDVVIEAFTIQNHQVVDVWPKPDGYWALSDNDANPTGDNWKTDCRGNTVITQPYYTSTRVDQYLLTDANTPGDKGYVAVEFYYCYHLVLDLPIMSNFIPDPMRIHAYTLMPLPAAAPLLPTAAP